MKKFHFINDCKNIPNFISMETFWDSIKKKNLNSSQNLFSPLEDKLDLFYICLLVGLKHDSKDDISNYDKDEITDKWTINLKNSKTSDYIIGLFLSKITKKHKENKSLINKELNEILDHNSDTKLSDVGLIELHNYAIGGYNIILKELDNKIPATLVNFFIKIYKLLN
jgi:hypothetical protein